MNDNLDDFWGEPISVYTRKEAIEDGTLIDITNIAEKTGFKCPVAVTSTVWEYISDIPEIYNEWQDVEDRIRDMLMALINETRKNTKKSLIITHVNMPYNEGETVKKQFVFKAIAGSGDEGELVVTIMLVNED